MKNKYGKYIRVRKYEFINYSTMNHKIMIRLENEYKIEVIRKEQNSNLSGTNVNKDTVNNIDLTINDIDDDNDNYFDDFYD